MQKPMYDPGLTQQYTGPLRRSINEDGSFNVRRRGGSWRDVHPYLILLNMRWPPFVAFLLASYFFTNVLFALTYFLFAPGQLQGNDAPTGWGRFLNDFFFSAHTLTTVGYGNISPRGLTANTVSAVEALTGVLLFAIATGLLFGRFSRPSARIAFSRHAIIAPYGGGSSLQFRIANLRPNTLMELEARVLLMVVERNDGGLRRVYKPLTLERPAVQFLPLTWTIVHPIDEESPMWHMKPDEMQRMEAELLILIKAWDDTFSQTVHAQRSYRHEEFLWDYRVSPAFQVDEDGGLVLDLNRISDCTPCPGPAPAARENQSG
jgi:inward rectifier potassium channel